MRLLREQVAKKHCRQQLLWTKASWLKHMISEHVYGRRAYLGANGAVDDLQFLHYGALGQLH